MFPRTALLIALLICVLLVPALANQPADPDAWTEYPDADTAMADGWVRECSLSQAIAVDMDCAMGACSVGCRATQARWCNEFGLEKAVPLTVTTALRFQHKASWPNLNFQVRLYMQPTPEEAAQGVQIKRLSWLMPTQTEWTENHFPMADGEWSWRVNNMWQMSGYEETLTEMVAIKWFFCTYFGVAVGDQLLIDDLALEQDSSAVPEVGIGQLGMPYPNPFNPGTEITFTLAEPRLACLAIYDVAGRRVRILAEGNFPAGESRRRWDGRDDRGAPLSAGAYTVMLEGGNWRSSRPVVLLK